MDSKQVVARFEAERQALALMDHPNIARVLDGGTTAAGRPYFVMDLVKGVPITKYCDEHRLTPRQRLELFVPVCQAVQHAHQKGVIHRDLKPSNVLVALYDGRPVPKVIDFGVAKAAGQPLTDRTLVTGFGAIVGTLEYMSPEQAEVNQLDIDTRSDIYSLGVLLYELLTGSPPFSKKELDKAGMLEMLRVIREQEPSRPSTKLSTADGLPTLAANRGTEPAKLTRLVRGELDWIVMKSLEKDRSRRYETANGFAADVLRYLSGESVTAVPPSLGYRARKFVKRNKGAVIAAGLILLTLVGGVVGTSLGLLEAKRQEGLAREEAQAKERALQAEAEERKKAETKEAEANAVVTFFVDRVFSAGRPKGEAGGLGHDVSLRDAIAASLPALSASFKDQPLVEARLRRTLGTTFSYLGQDNQAVEQLERSRELYTRLRGPDFSGTLASMNDLALVYGGLGRHAEALKLQQETLDIMKRVLPKDHPDTLRSMMNLASTYDVLGRHAEALKLREETLDIMRRVLPKDHPHTLAGMHNLGSSYNTLGRDAEALKLYQETLDIHRRVLPKDHPDTLAIMHNLANTLNQLGRGPEALKLYEETLEIKKRVLPKDHPDTLMGMCLLAIRYVEADRHAEARKLVEELLPKADLPTMDPRLYAEVLRVRVQCYLQAGDLAGCRATTERLEKRVPGDGYSLYDAARCRAMVAAVQAKASGAGAARLAREEGDKAMAWLRKAVAAGYKDVNWIKRDPTVDYLREREDFKKLLAELENRKN
jgi:tetratricopeptide (TPR) repeat protein